MMSGPQVNPSMEEVYQIDTSALDFYKRLKESVEQEDGKVSVLVKLYEEDYAKKVRHDLAFQNTFLLDKYQSAAGNFQ
jgi:hypothetical protein